MASPEWTSQQMPGQTGGCAIITGSNSGLGFEAAKALALKGAQVILAVRAPVKGEAAAQCIRRAQEAARVQVRQLDLASLASVKAFGDTFRQDHERLDLLINNAGVMMPPYSKTTEGFELQMGTNHLGHFALAGHLLELLATTPGARVVSLSSLAHRSGKLDFADLQWEGRRYRRWRSYADSKLANLLFSFELDRRLKEHGLGVLSVAAHPGWTSTNLQRHLGPLARFNFMAMRAPKGALPTLRAATEPGLQGGEFFGPGGPGQVWGYPVAVEASARARDPKLAKRLWELSEELTGVTYRFQGR